MTFHNYEPNYPLPGGLVRMAASALSRRSSFCSYANKSAVLEVHDDDGTRAESFLERGRLGGSMQESYRALSQLRKKTKNRLVQYSQLVLATSDKEDRCGKR